MSEDLTQLPPSERAMQVELRQGIDTLLSEVGKKAAASTGFDIQPYAVEKLRDLADELDAKESN